MEFAGSLSSKVPRKADHGGVSLELLHVKPPGVGAGDLADLWCCRLQGQPKPPVTEQLKGGRVWCNDSVFVTVYPFGPLASIFPFTHT